MDDLVDNEFFPPKPMQEQIKKWYAKVFFLMFNKNLSIETNLQAILKSCRKAQFCASGAAVGLRGSPLYRQKTSYITAKTARINNKEAPSTA